MIATGSWVAVVIAAAAMVSDIRTRKIPNLLTFGAAAAAVPYLLLTGGVHALGLGLLGATVGFLLFFPYFALGGLGAGDVKLLAALGMWLGPMPTLWAGLFASIAGGMMALVVAFARGYLREALTNLRLLLTHWRVSGLRPLESVALGSTRGPRLPYSLPIMTGLLVMLWLR